MVQTADQTRYYLRLIDLANGIIIDTASHRVYKMPWAGDPRVNIQNEKGKAKVYQVKQVLKAIDKLEADNG